VDGGRAAVDLATGAPYPAVPIRSESAPSANAFLLTFPTVLPYQGYRDFDGSLYLIHQVSCAEQQKEYRTVDAMAHRLESERVTAGKAVIGIAAALEFVHLRDVYVGDFRPGEPVLAEYGAFTGDAAGDEKAFADFVLQYFPDVAATPALAQELVTGRVSLFDHEELTAYRTRVHLLLESERRAKDLGGRSALRAQRGRPNPEAPHDLSYRGFDLPAESPRLSNTFAYQKSLGFIFQTRLPSRRR
jgi:hypothetical protein